MSLEDMIVISASITQIEKQKLQLFFFEQFFFENQNILKKEI
jgi:hypothetical protein